jgi:hypothetical protein
MVESAETEEESVGHHHVIPDRAKKPHHVIPSQPYSGAASDEFEEFEKEERLRSQGESEAETIGDAFWSEFELIWKVFKYVLKSWVMFPKKM